MLFKFAWTHSPEARDPPTRSRRTTTVLTPHLAIASRLMS